MIKSKIKVPKNETTTTLSTETETETLQKIVEDLVDIVASTSGENVDADLLHQSSKLHYEPDLGFFFKDAAVASTSGISSDVASLLERQLVSTNVEHSKNINFNNTANSKAIESSSAAPEVSLQHSNSHQPLLSCLENPTSAVPSTSKSIVSFFDSNADITAFFDTIMNSGDDNFDKQSVTLELRSEVMSSAAASSSDEGEYDLLPIDILSLALDELEAAKPKKDPLKALIYSDSLVPSTSSTSHIPHRSDSELDFVSILQKSEPSTSQPSLLPTPKAVVTDNNALDTSDYVNLQLKSKSKPNIPLTSYRNMAKKKLLKPTTSTPIASSLLLHKKSEPSFSYACESPAKALTKRAPPIPSPPKLSLLSKKFDKPRIISKVTIAPLQFKPYPGKILNSDSRISIIVKLDDDEVLQTMAVSGNPTRIFGEKVSVEMYRSNQLIKLTVLEHLQNYQTHQIGKIRLRRKDILTKNGVELTLPVETSPQATRTITAVLGEICLSILEDSSGNEQKKDKINVRYEIKSRMTISHNSTPTNAETTSQYNSLDTSIPSTSTGNTCDSTTTTTTVHSPAKIPTERVGDLKIQFWYSIEHILSLSHYEALYKALLESLLPDVFETSLASILQHLSIDLSHVARPLMKIYMINGMFTEYFRLICRQYMSLDRETSTLFRNQSMTSKLMHEMMKFVGSDYLVATLKPIIDIVYAEKRRCEVDPSKLRPGENLEENTRNLAVYAELAFFSVCESAKLCPPVLKNVFAMLREVVSEHYPEHVEISRLAVSSFIIMRFFAAAILNPTQYGLKRKAPEPDISRSLVLISKILQRLANCVVSKTPLTTKEEWLSKVLNRFIDPIHRAEMISFFDAISVSGAASLKKTPPMQRYSSTTSQYEFVVKSAHMVERRCGSGRRKSIKDFISQKRRFVMLTPTELSWQKVKEKDASGEYEQKGTIHVSEITSVAQISDTKTSFRVATPHQEVHFQAATQMEMADWIILLTTHQRKHLFCHNNNLISSPSNAIGNIETKLAHHIDLEKELETLHTLLIENIESFVGWKDALDAMDINVDVSAGDKFPQIMFLKLKDPASRKAQRDRLRKTINDVLITVQRIEEVHQQALAIAANMQNLQPLSKTEKTASNGLTDNENYLLMRSERNLKARMIPSHMAS